nr:putative integral membrane transport protein [uncultured bacterium]
MKPQFASNVPRYFVYTVLKGVAFGMITSFWLIYLTQRRGLTLTQATLVDVSFWIAATLGEIPTGVVADTMGRKASLAIGAGLMSVSVLAWAFAPTIPLIVITYAALSLGITFLTGADEAFFYETLQANGRSADYARLTGRVGAVMLAAMAVSNVASGLLASVDLILPFIAAAISMMLMLGVVLTFREPHVISKTNEASEARPSYAQILRQSLTIMRTRPTLRSAVLYLTIIPLAAILMETFFLQPQTLSLGVPLAAVGVVVMAVQIANMLGSAWSDRIQKRFGADRTVSRAPLFIIVSLLLLAALQIFPALIFIGFISFITSVVRPLLMSRIQAEVPDNIRATVLSMQSLMFTALFTVSEPLLGFTADHFGLSIAYVGLAAALGLLLLALVWKRRPRPMPAALATCA